jgi:hypothetical protein
MIFFGVSMAASFREESVRLARGQHNRDARRRKVPTRAALFAAVLACAALAPAARAERISYYRVGAGVAFPGMDVPSGTLSTGWAANLGVSVPFAHRFAATLDLSREQFADSGPEVAIPEAKIEKDDTAVSSALLGIELVTRRGSNMRPLLSAALGVAELKTGDSHVDDMNLGRYTVSGSDETVFALQLGAGLRWRLPAHHTAIRLHAQWMYLAAEKSSRTIPVTLQFEF